MTLNKAYQSFRYSIEKINAYFLIALLFVIPFSTAMGSILSGLILIFWLIDARFLEHFHQQKNNPIVIASLVFFILHIVGLLWTEDIDWGLHTLKKQWKFLILPIFMFYVRREYIRYYIYAFVLAMSLSELISYSIWFEFIAPFGNASVHNPTPFMTHITYNPLLAIAIYLVASDIIFHTNHFSYKKLLYFLFLITMTVNMFITGGRSGQIMFFAVIVILFFQYFSYSFIKTLFLSTLVSSIVFFSAYSTSKIFSERVDMAVKNILHYEQNKNSSVGKRVTFLLNGVEVFLNNPVAGVGTGDLPEAMHQIHIINSPEVKAPDNPHNIYIMLSVEFGLLGLISLFWLFYSQIKFASSNNNDFMRRFGVALPVLYIVANFGESYLSVHATSLLFSVFSAIIYAQYKDSSH